MAITIMVLIAGFAIKILWDLFKGKIDLAYLLSEPADPHAQMTAQALGQKPEPPEKPKASMARLQLLIFTFVIAGIYLVLCLESGSFVEIPEHALWLLGISGGTYAASKTIKAAGDSKSADAAIEVSKNIGTTGTTTTVTSNPNTTTNPSTTTDPNTTTGTQD
ncbi:hypothetical protein [Sphingomonas sp. KR3-1]|uniref:hypothetical protein n=1 Tax=Sphingomonas sp. KR3-1 TaxID=3156611 RepID=UPI0032B31909